jgi:serine/threonine protein kinase
MSDIQLHTFSHFTLLSDTASTACFHSCDSHSPTQTQQIHILLQVMTLRYRAPEIMLGVREYSAAVDMWSVGCMMAEMVRGDTPFKGENEIDQLLKIFELLGRPCPQEWPEVQQGENFQTCFPRWPKPPNLSHVRTHCSSYTDLSSSPRCDYIARRAKTITGKCAPKIPQHECETGAFLCPACITGRSSAQHHQIHRHPLLRDSMHVSHARRFYVPSVTGSCSLDPSHSQQCPHEAFE